MRSMLYVILFLLPGLVAIVGCTAAGAAVPPAPVGTGSLGSVTASSVETSVSATPTVTLPSLQPFLEPEAHYEPILAALGKAKSSIRMETYLLTASDVIDSLKAASRKQVDVRVLLEGQPADAGVGNKAAVSELETANIKVRSGNPAFKRTHANFIIIDDRTVIVMTFAQTFESFTLNREFGILDSEPGDVAEAIAVFDADWDRTEASVSPTSNLVVGPNGSRGRLLALIDGARQTLDVETEELQDTEVEDHLVAAVRRGVAVRVVMSPTRSGVDLNQRARERILAGGVKVRLLKTPYIQASMIVADNARGFIGSQEFVPLSLDASRELGIETRNARIIEGLSGTFLVDWNLGK